jgi:hypothetical protein
MSPSAHPRVGQVASRVTGALALSMVMCLVLAPNASADSESYLVSGTATGDDILIGGVDGFFGNYPTISTPFQVTTAPVKGTYTDVEPGEVATIGQLSMSITGPQSDVVDTSAAFSDVTAGGGLVTADGIDAQCTAGPDVTSGSSTFENVVVNGVTMPDDPAPNTVVTTPEGTVTLDEITDTRAGDVEVKAIDIEYTTEEAPGEGYLILGELKCQGEEGYPMPVGEIGGLLFTGVLGVLFTVRQLRRRPS